MSSKRKILVASTGGHLAQMYRLRKVFQATDSPLWITFDHPQSRSLLAEEDNVLFVPYIKSRDIWQAIKIIPILWRSINSRDYDQILSTGAAVCVPAFAVAFCKGVKRQYIESVSRFDGPSLSGRLVSFIPGTRLLTQHKKWSSRRWQLTNSVLDEFSLEQDIDGNHNPVRRIFVTLGTIRPYRFDRLVDTVLASIRASDEVVWQLGETTRTDLPGNFEQVYSDEQMTRLIDWADIVVTHAGVGSALKILEAGKSPLLGVRDPSNHEHVDSHQTQIARELSRRGLATVLALGENQSSLFDQAIDKVVRHS